MIKRLIHVNGVEISTLHIMSLFMPLVLSDDIEHISIEKLETTVRTFLSEIEILIKRKIQVNEMEKLFDGIKHHFNTEMATEERRKSMKYLFELEFLNP